MGLRKKLKKALNCSNHIALTKEGIKKYDLRGAIHSCMYDCLCDHLDEYIPLVDEYEDVSSMLDYADIVFEVEVADLKDRITVQKLLDYGFVEKSNDTNNKIIYMYKIDDMYSYCIESYITLRPFLMTTCILSDNTIVQTSKNWLTTYPIEYMHQVRDVFRMAFNEELTRKEQG